MRKLVPFSEDKTSDDRYADDAGMADQDGSFYALIKAAILYADERIVTQG